MSAVLSAVDAWKARLAVFTATGIATAVIAVIQSVR